MTPSTMRRFDDRYRVLFLIIAVVLLAPGAAVAQQQFGVTVPGREAPTTTDGLPIAKIKITLELTAEPTSFTLTRKSTDGTSDLGSVSSFSALPSSFGADEVQVSKDGDAMVITLLPSSNLGSNNCQRSPTAGSERINMELSVSGTASSPTISGYRLTSYRAPSTNYGCSCESRRIIDMPSQWGSGSFGSPPGTDLGRHPLSMIMVLDESGSMGLPLGGGDTRMERLNQHAANVVDLWGSTMNQPGSDEIGVVYFTTGVTPLTFPPENTFFVSRNASTPGGRWSDIEPILRARTDKDMTAMGDGLNEAFDRKGTREDVAIILFTDGIENRGTYRTRSCSDVPAGTCPSSAPADRMNLWDASSSDIISISGQCAITQTIGLGAPGSIQSDRLDRMALQTGGVSTTELTMGAGSFQQALINILDASSLHEVFRATSTMGASESAGVSRKIYVSNAAQQMIVSLSWYGLDQADAMNLRFTDPNGDERRPDDVIRRQDYMIASFGFNKKPQSGAWQVDVVRGDSDETIEYEVAGMLDDTVLNYDLAWHKPSYFTGETAYLLATVTENGEPAEGLSPDDLQFTLRRPSVGLGTVLFNQQVSEEIYERGVPKLGEDQPASAYGRKVQHLLVQNKEVATQIAPNEADQRLTVQRGPIKLEDGTPVGGKATFVVEIPGTTTPGTYDVRMDLQGNLELSGRVERRERIQVPVHVRPNLAVSEVAAEAGDSAIRLSFVPKDLYENYLGPGFGQAFRVRVLGRDEPLPVKAADRDVRGIYEMDIQDVRVEDNPTLVFEVNGRPFHVVTAEELISGEISKDPRLDKISAGSQDDGDIEEKNGSGGGCDRSDSGSTSGIIFFVAAVMGWVNVRRRAQGRTEDTSSA